MALQIYNTLSRSKQEFTPIDPSLVKMYVCGPTVYGHAHLGHAKSYVSFDVVRRHLMHRYGREHVLYVMNITDVGHLVSDADEGEDKVEAQARRENRSPFEIAATYEASFWEDMRRLNTLMPDRIPHATDFIRQQIQMVSTLIEKGLAYDASGSVYFDVAEYERRQLDEHLVPYGGLSNRQTEELQSGGRVAGNPDKRAPHDFALWKRAEPEHFMQWYSPWGWGFPGWHLECSVMSQFYLGQPFDIHGGGIENQFPHHECEIAQSQGAADKPFVNYWMHNNMVTTRGTKMGKSLGNAKNLKDFFAEFDPLAIRFFILQSHYRSPLELDVEAIAAAQTGLMRMRNTLARLVERVGTHHAAANGDGSTPAFVDAFLKAMDDDFNTPVALGALSEGIAAVNRELADASPSDETLRHLARGIALIDGIVGLQLLEAPSAGERGDSIAGELMDVLIELRRDARARKDFKTGDEIRDRLLQIGVRLEDSKEGTRWVRER